MRTHRVSTPPIYGDFYPNSPTRIAIPYTKVPFAFFCGRSCTTMRRANMVVFQCFTLRALRAAFIALLCLVLTKVPRAAEQALVERAARHVLQVFGPSFGRAEERGQESALFQDAHRRHHQPVQYSTVQYTLYMWYNTVICSNCLISSFLLLLYNTEVRGGTHVVVLLCLLKKKNWQSVDRRALSRIFTVEDISYLSTVSSLYHRVYIHVRACLPCWGAIVWGFGAVLEAKLSSFAMRSN